MVEFEADNALAVAAVAAARDSRVARVIICTPDKDLAQCVRGIRFVQLNRRTRVTFDEPAVVRKFGASPGIDPRLSGARGRIRQMAILGRQSGGAKSSAAILAKFLHIESIPADCLEWCVNAANASALANTLCRERDRAILFRTLATLRTDIALFDDVDEFCWNAEPDRSNEG